jgi:hypothetical protein
MGNFYTDTICNDPRFNQASRVSALGLLEPITRERAQALIVEANRRGEPLMAYETFRSKARQAQLFARGASKLREVGVHHYGLALDIVKDVDGDPSWKGSFVLLGELAPIYGLIWGGSWKNFKDLVHVQRCEVGQQKALFAGLWYPES